MDNRIRKFTIVGGGSAGWLAASLLLGALNRRNDGPDTEITLIESPNVPAIGVGEATTLSMMVTFDQLRIDERDFLKACDGTLKAAVKFTGWDRGEGGTPLSYYHPFDAPPYIYGFAPAYHYHRRARAGRTQPPFAHCMSVLPALLDRDLAPRTAEADDYQGIANYSYHLDAVQLGRYLKTYCTTLGVRYVSDDVVDVTVNEGGFITALELKEHGTHPVEFVIDCSGFRGLILRKALGEPFIPYGDQLLCDRAVAAQVPYRDGAKLEPFTTSTALGAGWAWNVPLYSRRGTGYVFSSRFISDDEAIAEFLAHLGADGEAAEPRVIPMTIGRLRRSWVNNCLAVGLAGGFVEPLESTSIHLTQISLRRFLDHLPDRSFNPVLIDRYNLLVTQMYEDIRDFIVLHYRASNRDDSPFWRAATAEIEIPGTVRERLELWRHKLPTALDLAVTNPLFTEWSYLYVLFGKGYFDGIDFPADAAICDDDFDAFLAGMEEQRQAALARAPDHRRLLTSIHQRDAAPWYGSAAVAAGGGTPGG